MAFNPFNLFKGNPKVLELMLNNQQIEMLLMEQAFPSQFKRSDNEALCNYINFERYQQLIKYITVINQGKIEDKNKTFKQKHFNQIPIRVSINSVCQQLNYFQVSFVRNQVRLGGNYLGNISLSNLQQSQKSLDSESSDRSYSSIKSNNSNTCKVEKIESRQFEESDKQNFILGNQNDNHLSDYDFSNDKEISQDDFPDARLKKTVIVKQIFRRTVKRPVQPLIFKVIDFFKNSQITHILDGYVCKVLENVLNNRFQTFISLVHKYQSFSYLKAIFSHIQSTSVQQLLLNFINRSIDFGTDDTVNNEATLIDYIQDVSLQDFEQWYSVDLNLQDRAQYLNLYALVIQKLTLKMKQNQSKAKQGNKQLNISKQLNIVNEIINKKNVQKVISILGQIIETFHKDAQLSKAIFSYLKIVKSILNCFLQLSQLQKCLYLPKQQLSIIKEMFQSCEDVFDRIISLGLDFVFEDYLFHDLQNIKKFKPKNLLGAKIQFLQIIAKLIQEDIYFSKRTILDCPSFQNILGLFEVYPNSSMFHNCIMKIIALFLVADIDIITLNKFFGKQKLLDFLYFTVKQDYLIRCENRGKSRKCYIGQIVSICLLIEKMNRDESEELLKYRTSKQWLQINQCLLEQEKGARKQVLGGHQKPAEKLPTIFFTKNECLNHFKYFLSGQKFSLFDHFQNYEPSNSDSEDQSQQNKIRVQKSQDKMLQQKIDQSKYFDQNIDL